MEEKKSPSRRNPFTRERKNDKKVTFEKDDVNDSIRYHRHGVKNDRSKPGTPLIVDDHRQTGNGEKVTFEMGDKNDNNISIRYHGATNKNQSRVENRSKRDAPLFGDDQYSGKTSTFDFGTTEINENNNNIIRDYGTQNKNQSRAENQPRPAAPLVGDESIVDRTRAKVARVNQGGADLAEEILNFFASGDDANQNAAGTNVFLSEGFHGVDPLIALKDCCCKSPLLESLKKQTEALVKEKEAHEATLAKRITSEREATSLRIQITDFVERERHLTADNNQLCATVEQLKAEVKAQKEAARNSDILVERIRCELVAKLSELAREVQKGNKAEADVALLEQQVETLQGQVSEYDAERITLERERGDLQTRFVEGLAKLKSLKIESTIEKDEQMQKIAAMREQVNIMSKQKTLAEQERRVYREKVETLAAAASKDKKQIQELEEALNLEEARHGSTATNMKNEIARLEKLVHDIKAKTVMDISGLDRSRGQCDNLLMRATKEIAHLDQTTEDMRKHLEALNDECQSLKEEKKIVGDEAKSNEEKWNHEREKLLYEINRLGKVSAEMDEGRNEAEIKIMELQNELSDAEQLLRIQKQEREDLEKEMDERTKKLNDALKGANEKIRSELEAVKAALKAKSTELQNLKASVNAAGGDVSLMPLDREDYKRTMRESEELRRQNAQMREDLIRSSARESGLESDLEGVIGKEAATAAARKDREARLTADLTDLHGQLEETRIALTAAEAETKKLTTILKENLAAAPIDIHAEMYQKKTAQTEEAGENRDEKRGTFDDDGGGGGGGASSPKRTSLQVLAHRMKVARNYQLRKGVGEAIRRVGLNNDELSVLAEAYEGKHLDFNDLLEKLLHKAQTYRAERSGLANQIKKLKVETHFLKLELTLYKELEIKMKELGGLDEEAVKNAKVDVAEKVAKQPQELDPDIAAAIDGGEGSEYAKSSIVKMTTMFAEQKHILDIAAEFRTLDDLLKALRDDIAAETKALKKEIVSLIHLVDGMKPGGEKNVNAIDDNDDGDNDDDDGGDYHGIVTRRNVGSLHRAVVDSERFSFVGESRRSARHSLRGVDDGNMNLAGDPEEVVLSATHSRPSGSPSMMEVEEIGSKRAVDSEAFSSTGEKLRRTEKKPSREAERKNGIEKEKKGYDDRRSKKTEKPRNAETRDSAMTKTPPMSKRSGKDVADPAVEWDESTPAIGTKLKTSMEGGSSSQSSDDFVGNDGWPTTNSRTFKKATPLKTASYTKLSSEKEYSMTKATVARWSTSSDGENANRGANNDAGNCHRVDDEEDGTAARNTSANAASNPRVDFQLPAAPRDSNKTNLSGLSGVVDAAAGKEKGISTPEEILKEASLEEVEEAEVAFDRGVLALERRNRRVENAGKRETASSEARQERRRETEWRREKTSSPSGTEEKYEPWERGSEDGTFEHRDKLHQRRPQRQPEQKQRHLRWQSRKTDKRGNVFTEDDAGRRWIEDEVGHKWRQGPDGRQYLIDNDGVEWNVEEVDGRRRRWRRNSRGEYVYAEEDGVEWIAADGEGRGGCARRWDEEGKEVMKDAEGVEWTLDDVGRGWRENEKGRIFLLDKQGRVWKLDERRKFGRRRDALGQKWMIDEGGYVWLVADDGRGWRVDSRTNILALETTFDASRGAGGGGGGTAGGRCAWLMERSTGIQWLVDENRRRLRAANREEALTVPPEVKMLWKTEFTAMAAWKGRETDSDEVVESKIQGASRRGKGGSGRGSGGNGRGGGGNGRGSGRRSARKGRRWAAEEEEKEKALERRRREKARSGRKKRAAESEKESRISSSDAERKRRKRRKEKRSGTRSSTSSLSSSVTSLRRTPSQLRAKAEMIRGEVAARKQSLGPNIAAPPPKRPDEFSYVEYARGM